MSRKPCCLHPAHYPVESDAACLFGIVRRVVLRELRKSSGKVTLGLERMLAGMAAASVLYSGHALAQTPARPSDEEPLWGTVQLAPFAGIQFGGSGTSASGRG